MANPITTPNFLAIFSSSHLDDRLFEPAWQSEPGFLIHPATVSARAMWAAQLLSGWNTSTKLPKKGQTVFIE
jgi:hypothetical protein